MPFHPANTGNVINVSEKQISRFIQQLENKDHNEAELYAIPLAISYHKKSLSRITLKGVDRSLADIIIWLWSTGSRSASTTLFSDTPLIPNFSIRLDRYDILICFFYLDEQDVPKYKMVYSNCTEERANGKNTRPDWVQFTEWRWTMLSFKW